MHATAFTSTVSPGTQEVKDVVPQIQIHDSDAGEPPSDTASGPPSPASSISSLPRSHDPHHLPKFSSTTLTKPTQPILYLPPLLSSLPYTYPTHIPFSASRSTKANSDSKSNPLTTETRLPDIDPASLSLHKALHHFAPRDDRYAAVGYEEAFNWDELRLPEEEEREWYCVAFRSLRKPGSESGPLYEADKQAHEEAIRNGGLILYWYGIPDPVTGLNLATCIWQSRAHAVAANGRPHHIRAMRLAANSYAKYDLERYTLRKVRGETGVKVLPFEGGQVGW